MKMLVYEMEIVSSVNNIKDDDTDEHSKHLHIFQIYHKFKKKKHHQKTQSNISMRKDRHNTA